jgi:hypothetical protein
MEQLSNTPQGVVATPMSSQMTPLDTSRKSHKKLGIVILLIPVMLFILGTILVAITFKVNPEYYTLSLTKSFPVGKIADVTLGLSGMLFPLCLIAGIVLIRKNSST